MTLERNVPRRTELARSTIIVGLIAGAAMIPFGFALRAMGHSVNVYGERVVHALLGEVTAGALIGLHVLISIGLALPYVAIRSLTSQGFDEAMRDEIRARVNKLVSELVEP